jgi:hypothetical protein
MRRGGAAFGAFSGDRLVGLGLLDVAPVGGDPDLMAIWYVQQIVHRIHAQPDLMVAFFELRLETRRHPELRATLEETLRREYEADVVFNLRAGLPGGAWEIMLLHFAIDGLMLDQLTVSIGADAGVVDAIVEALVRRVLPGE